jgi:hypothetical protein
MKEKTDKWFSTKYQNQCCQYSTDCRCTQTKPESLPYPTGIACTIVETDDRLSRLCYGIIYHEHDGIEITCHAERCHTIFAQLANKYIIAGKQYH